jgi:hypothetical protein
MADALPQPDPREPTPDAAAPAGAVRQLVFTKHGQNFIFRYAPGEEARVLENLTVMARDPDSGLDWFDAAVLSHQLGRHISEDLEQLRKP